MIKICTFLFVTLFSCIASASASEQLVIVVNKNNPVEQLSKSEVIDIFMGKYLAYPNGDFATPIELQDNNLVKEVFYQDLIGRSLASVNSYWARLKFSGRKRKAETLESEEEVIKLIDETNLAIGYIRESKLTENLKVVYRFNE
ncbi:MAG: hypothetical protein ACSHW0_09275 [Thalassotalea sp.]